MTPTHNNLRRLFDLLLESAPEARPALLDHECAGNPDLRQRLETMLAAAERPDNFLAPASTLKSAPAETPGTVIGRYKLLQKIGEGGFGAVFLAGQREPVARKVALKIIKLGMDTRQVIARFEAERQALALMDHPNIARVLDAGATDAGRPYFVMEYVKGDPIIAFADAHKLSLPERLTLFTQVCQAVQHAHTKGIIHRDLKPGNILVSMSDGKPFARVIDFGIAKATGAAGGRLTDKTLFTEHHQLIGTPEYMSPEQAEGSPDIDTRTDVYSLGVLLYELLAGATPFDPDRLRSAAFAEMQRIIKEEDPPSPSLRLTRRLGTPTPGGLPLRGGSSPGGSPLRGEALHAQGVPPASTGPSLDIVAAARRSDPAKLAPLIKGELDWIVMKALDKDRARRYETPSQLAADVQRHLAGEVVIAAPPSVAYRVTKFVKRNRNAVTVGSLLVTILVLGIGATAWGWRTASHANSRSRAQAESARRKLEQIVLGYPPEFTDQNNWVTATDPENMLKLSVRSDGDGTRHIEVRRDGAKATPVTFEDHIDLFGTVAEFAISAETSLRRSLGNANVLLQAQVREARLAAADLVLRPVVGDLETKAKLLEDAAFTYSEILGPHHPRTILGLLIAGRYMVGEREEEGLSLMRDAVSRWKTSQVLPDDLMIAWLLEAGDLFVRVWCLDDAREAYGQALLGSRQLALASGKSPGEVVKHSGYVREFRLNLPNNWPGEGLTAWEYPSENELEHFAGGGLDQAALSWSSYRAWELIAIGVEGPLARSAREIASYAGHALSVDPDNLQNRVALAGAFYYSGLHREALVVLDGMPTSDRLAVDAPRLVGLAIRSMCLFKLGRHEEAQAAFADLRALVRDVNRADNWVDDPVAVLDIFDRAERLFSNRWNR